jgi:tetratricopeptide (TPR) repeat protein
MSRAWLVPCLLLLGAGSAARAVAGQVRAPGSGTLLPVSESVSPDRLERLERWLKAAARHAPGEADDELIEVAHWSNLDLRQLWIETNVLAQIMRNPQSDRYLVRAEGQKASTQIRYTTAQLRRLRVLACAAGGELVDPDCLAVRAGAELEPDLLRLAALARASRLRGDGNYILRRGALLHTDIAMLPPPFSFPSPDRSTSNLGPQRWRIEISDGRQVDLRQSAVHWEIGRMLLDFVGSRSRGAPDPGHDEMVQQWYRATAAWMQLREDHDKLHLERARAIFPADPDILFLSACQHETFAGAPIQTAVQSMVLPTGVTMDVGSARDELRAAEVLFARALEIKPDYAEARARHGRVLALLERHADAITELRRAVAALSETVLLYDAELFLGSEEEALGNRDAARAAYEHAAALAPLAQSPLLALSSLASRVGNRTDALRAMERLFALAADGIDDDDPWWWYFVIQARDAETLLDAVRRPFLAERLQ